MSRSVQTFFNSFSQEALEQTKISWTFADKKNALATVKESLANLMTKKRRMS